MKNSLGPSKRGNGLAIGAVICFVAVIGMVGVYTVRQYRVGVEKELAKAEKKQEEKKEQIESTGGGQDLVINTLQREQGIAEEAPQVTEQPETVEEKSEVVAEQPSKPQFSFSEKDLILWPIENGEVILNYSMNKTVYFPTLDQYKYNPAMIIKGAEGTQVMSVARGVVKSIDVTSQTGTTVTVDMGNGYESIYGQLKEVPVNVGDTVEAKTVLGYLSEPTKYYSVEGCNLYFEMRKDGQPINPNDFLGE